ncbi:MAG: ribosome silencing factor [Pseudomonadales bacterium]
MTSKELLSLIESALDDMKAHDVVALDVSSLTDLTDYMVIASGTSNRHVNALAENVELEAKKVGLRAIGVEGKDGSEWVLVDFADVVVHIMQPSIRSFYDLESLWSDMGEVSQPQE